MTTTIDQGSTVVDNIVRAALRDWRDGGYDSPREYLTRFHEVGLLATDEFVAACAELDRL